LWIDFFGEFNGGYGGVAVETRRRPILSGKRVLQRTEREQPSLTLFLCFLNYFNKVYFSLLLSRGKKNHSFNFRLSYTLNDTC
jgi:predicted ferric reductase